MEQLYCSIFIVDVSQNPEEVDTVSSRIQQLIEDHGGVIKRHNPWGKKRLAYPIQDKTSGFYVEIEFVANSHLNIPKIIEGEYRLNDRVLRYLTYVITKMELKQREMDAAKAKTSIPVPSENQVKTEIPEKTASVENNNNASTNDENEKKDAFIEKTDSVVEEVVPVNEETESN